MTAEPTRRANEPQRDDSRRERSLRTSRFDSVTAWLTSVMVLLGVIVGLLGVVWLVSGSQNSLEHATVSPHVVWGTVNPPGQEQDFLESGIEEIVELEKPEIRQSLVAVTDLVSTVSGTLEPSEGTTTGPGQRQQGDRRDPGPEQGIQDIVPRFERWQLDFQAKNQSQYARQLDHFAIELGVIGGSVQGVDYVRKLAGGGELRRGESESERRLYFMWTRPSPLQRFDWQLLTAAGADVIGREMLKFIPRRLENQLAQLELEYARAHGVASAKSIARTVFSCRPTGEKLEFVVVSQQLRE